MQRNGHTTDLVLLDDVCKACSVRYVCAAKKQGIESRSMAVAVAAMLLQDKHSGSVWSNEGQLLAGATRAACAVRENVLHVMLRVAFYPQQWLP